MICADFDGIEASAVLHGNVQSVLNLSDDINAGDGDSQARTHAHPGDGGGAGSASAFGDGKNVFHAGSGDLQVAAGQQDLGIAGLYLCFCFSSQDVDRQSACNTDVALGIAGAGSSAGDQLAVIAAGDGVNFQATGSDLGIRNKSMIFMVSNGYIHANTCGEGSLSGFGEAAIVADEIAVDLKGQACVVCAVGILQSISISAACIGSDDLHHFGVAHAVNDMDLQGVLFQHVALVGSDYKADGIAQICFLLGGDGAVDIGNHGDIIRAADGCALSRGNLDRSGESLRNHEGEGAVGVLGDLDVDRFCRCGGSSAVDTGGGNGLAAGNGNIQILAGTQGGFRHGQHHGIACAGGGIGSLQIAVGGDAQVVILEGNNKFHVSRGHHEGVLVIADRSHCNAGIAGKVEGRDLALIGCYRNGNGITGIGAGNNFQPVCVHAGIREGAGNSVLIRHKAGGNGIGCTLGNRDIGSIGSVRVGGCGNLLILSVRVQIIDFQSRELCAADCLQQVAGFGGHSESQSDVAHSGDLVGNADVDLAIYHAGNDQLGVICFIADISGRGGGDQIAGHAVGRLGHGDIGITVLVILHNVAVSQSGMLRHSVCFNLHGAIGLNLAGGICIGIIIINDNAYGKCANQLTTDGTAASAAAGAAAGTGSTGGELCHELHIARRHGEDVFALGICLDLGSGLTAIQVDDQFQLFQDLIHAGCCPNENLLPCVSGLGVSGDQAGTGTVISGIADGVSSAIGFGGHESAAICGSVVQLVLDGSINFAGTLGQRLLTVCQLPECCLDHHILVGHGKGEVGTGGALGGVHQSLQEGQSAGIIGHPQGDGIDGVAGIGGHFDESLGLAGALMGSDHGAVADCVYLNNKGTAGNMSIGLIEGINELIDPSRVLESRNRIILKSREQSAHQVDDLCGGLALGHRGGVCGRVSLGDDHFLGVAENVYIAVFRGETAVALQRSFHILHHNRDGKEAAEIDAGVGDGILLLGGNGCLDGGIGFNVGCGISVQDNISVTGDHFTFYGDIHIVGNNSQCQGNRQSANSCEVVRLHGGSCLEFNGAAGFDPAGTADIDLIIGYQDHHRQRHKQHCEYGVACFLHDGIGRSSGNAAACADSAIHIDVGNDALNGGGGKSGHDQQRLGHGACCAEDHGTVGVDLGVLSDRDLGTSGELQNAQRYIHLQTDTAGEGIDHGAEVRVAVFSDHGDVIAIEGRALCNGDILAFQHNVHGGGIQIGDQNVLDHDLQVCHEQFLLYAVHHGANEGQVLGNDLGVVDHIVVESLIRFIIILIVSTFPQLQISFCDLAGGLAGEVIGKVFHPTEGNGKLLPFFCGQVHIFLAHCMGSIFFQTAGQVQPVIADAAVDGDVANFLRHCRIDLHHIITGTGVDADRAFLKGIGVCTC